ncbi:hypothetical protein H7200_00095 [Candidatus Saccharibacteria bacterium]|nr:hypothetical protein [Candidatus Saccharibacteria bacterium]
MSESEKSLLADLVRIKENSKGEPLTWGATPLIASIDIKLQQDSVKEVINSLFEDENVPNYVSPVLASYIDVLNMSRTANRESKNQDSFAYRQKTDLDGVPLESLEVFERALRGYASPAELLFLSKMLGIPTIELASLTHPYGQRIELLKEMRPSVNNAIELMGGTLVRGIAPEYEVKASDNPHNPQKMQGLHMTRKTLFGSLPGGTDIIERSSFVILLDRIPAETAKVIRSVRYEENPQWSKQVFKRAALDVVVPVLLADDEHDKAVPVSTTVVAVNETLSQLLLTESAIQARQRQYMANHAVNNLITL